MSGKFAILLALASLPLCAISFPMQARAGDLYSDYMDMAQHNREGADFRVDTRSIGTRFSVIAIHGGMIENGSAQLARAIAANDLSYYIFQAIRPNNNWDLHVTSTHFDDPRALAIVGSSESSISIHGFTDDAKDIACVGGGNIPFRDWMAHWLSTAHFPIPVTIESPCAIFGGSDPQNITNRSRLQGVQIELSSHLRKAMLQNPVLLNSFASAVREVSANYPPAARQTSQSSLLKQPASAFVGPIQNLTPVRAPAETAGTANSAQ